MLMTIMGKANQGVRWFYTYTGGAPTVANLSAMGTLLDNQAKTAFEPLMTPDRGITSWVLEDLSSATANVATVPSSVLGSAPNDANPANVAIVTSYQINRRYRGGRPKTYWPFGTSFDFTPTGEWNPNFVASVQSGVIQVIDAPIGAPEGSTTLANHVNVSYYQGYTNITDPVTGRVRSIPKLRAAPQVDVITGVLAEGYAASQRRRRSGVGG